MFAFPVPMLTHSVLLLLHEHTNKLLSGSHPPLLPLSLICWTYRPLHICDCINQPRAKQTTIERVDSELIARTRARARSSKQQLKRLPHHEITKSLNRAMPCMHIACVRLCNHVLSVARSKRLKQHPSLSESARDAHVDWYVASRRTNRMLWALR